MSKKEVSLAELIDGNDPGYHHVSLEIGGIYSLKSAILKRHHIDALIEATQKIVDDALKEYWNDD